MFKNKSLIIKFLTIILFMIGAMAILVWVLNTVSQNKAITTRFIGYQIHRLLDLDSEVVNPHAYLDWDLQYKIRADKLTFINNDNDLVAVEDIHVNVFIPYMLIRKIYITHMSGKNLYADFERYPDKKINIIEIFNITGFFKIYFHNSTISIDKYFFRFRDNFHKPSEKMVVTGNNILISKYTLKKYFQVIMDGNINYNGTVTPFSVNYNAKLQNIAKDFNLEVNLPDLKFENFKSYTKEFAPDLTLKGQGNVRVKTSKARFYNVDMTLRNVDIHTPKIKYSLSFAAPTSVFARFSYDNHIALIDELKLSGKDYAASTSGKIRTDGFIDLHVKVDENSNGNSMLQLVPRGVPALHHALDKAKDYNLGGLISADVSLRGKINHITGNGYVKINKANIGYGYNFPASHVYLDFKNEKMFINSRYYQSPNAREYVDINGNIKITKPFVLNLQIDSTQNNDLVSTQKAINIFSDLFNFKTGPVPVMGIHRGRGEIKLHVLGTPPLVNLNGKMSFRNGIASYPGLNGYISDIYGEIYFDGKVINYKNIKGIQDGVWAFAHGQTRVHENGLTHFYLNIPNASLLQAKNFIDNSTLLDKVSKAIRTIQSPAGSGSLSMVIVSDKETTAEPYVEGIVKVNNSSCAVEGLAYRAEDVSGTVNFTSVKSSLNFTGIVNGIKTKLTGTARQDYSDIVIETPEADVQSAMEFLRKSPMFENMHKTLDDFSELSGKIRTRTKLFGNLSAKLPDFHTEVNIIQGKLKYLDVPEEITLKGGNLTAQKDKVMINGISGLVMNAPFRLSGIVTDAGLKTEKRNLRFNISGLYLKNIEKIIGTKILPHEVSENLSAVSFKDGFVDVTSYVSEAESKANIVFHDANVIYNKTKDNIIFQSGEFFYSTDILKLKNIVAHMANSDFIIDGTIANYINNPLFNINLASNLSEIDFNKTLVPMFELPFSLAGKIYTNIAFSGTLNDWKLKMRAMLEDNSYIVYKDANLGEDLSKFVFFDIVGNGNDVEINTFDVYSPTYTTSQNTPDIIAKIKGKIKNINTDNPYLDNLDVKFNDYMNISFLNILFYDPSKQPFLKSGLIKGHVTLDGELKNLRILGKADVKDALISAISTTVKTMNIEFNNSIIDISDAIVNIAGSEAVINATLNNKFITPVTISKLDLKSDYINMDKMLQTFTGLFAYKSKDGEENNKEFVIPVTTETTPIVIENGNVNVKELLYNNLSAKDFSAEFFITPQWQCSIKNLHADVTDGTINGDIDYNFYTTDLTGNLEVKDVVANDFATAFLNLPNEMYGKLDANAKFSTKGKNHDNMIENLNGMAYFKLNNGRMIRLGSVEYMLKTANTVKGGIPRLNLNALVNIVAPRTGYFDTIEGDFQIKDGVILTDKITSKSKELNLFMTGAYNMNNSLVNATIIGQLPMESKESILWLGPLGKISLNSVIRQLTRQNSKEYENMFFSNPLQYINEIPGLKANRGDYRFFVVSLNGNLYEDNYVDKFKWIK